MTAQVEEKEILPELPYKQQKFADFYLADPNITQAYIKAGYEPKAAHACGSRLLKSAKVSAYIKARKAQLHSENQLDQAYVRRNLQAIADNGKVESNRVRALELLGKDLGMWKENLSINTAVFQNFGQEILSKLASNDIQHVVVDATKGIKDNTPKDQELTQVAQLKEVGY